MFDTIEEAIQTALEHLPIQRKISAPKFQCGFAIVLREGKYSVYRADAWVPPTNQPILLWSPPKGEVVMYVRQPNSDRRGRWEDCHLQPNWLD